MKVLSDYEIELLIDAISNKNDYLTVGYKDAQYFVPLTKELYSLFQRILGNKVVLSFEQYIISVYAKDNKHVSIFKYSNIEDSLGICELRLDNNYNAFNRLILGERVNNMEKSFDCNKLYINYINSLVGKVYRNPIYPHLLYSFSIKHGYVIAETYYKKNLCIASYAELNPCDIPNIFTFKYVTSQSKLHTAICLVNKAMDCKTKDIERLTNKVNKRYGDIVNNIISNMNENG